MRALGFKAGLCAAALLLCGSAAAQSLVTEPQVPPNPEDIRHGAVLCGWSLYLSAREVGNACHPAEDKALRAELSSSIRRMETFITVNGHPGPSYIAIWESRVHADAVAGHVCTSTQGEKLYQVFKRLGPDGVRRQTDLMLAIPRPPAMNPCL